MWEKSRIRGKVLFKFALQAFSRNLKRTWDFFSWNYIFGSFEHFPSTKIDFWPFLKLQKMEFGQKKIREIDLFDFTNFFGLDFFFNFGPLWCGNSCVDTRQHVICNILIWIKNNDNKYALFIWNTNMGPGENVEYCRLVVIVHKVF